MHLPSADSSADAVGSVAVSDVSGRLPSVAHETVIVWVAPCDSVFLIGLRFALWLLPGGICHDGDSYMPCCRSLFATALGMSVCCIPFSGV